MTVTIGPVYACCARCRDNPDAIKPTRLVEILRQTMMDGMPEHWRVKRLDRQDRRDLAAPMERDLIMERMRTKARTVTTFDDIPPSATEQFTIKCRTCGTRTGNLTKKALCDRAKRAAPGTYIYI